MSVCRWCGQHLHTVAGEWYSDDGLLCTPVARGAVCRLLHYPTLFGIDPLRLQVHDDVCACRRSVVHVPVTTGTPPGTATPSMNRTPE